MQNDRFAFVHLDADLEAPIAAGLEFFWPRLTPGEWIVVHDYNAWPERGSPSINSKTAGKNRRRADA